MANLSSLLVIGISSDLNALKDFFGEENRQGSTTILVVQNVEPSERPLDPERLQKMAKIPVVYPSEDCQLKPGSLYLIPPFMTATVDKRDRLQIYKFSEPDDRHNVIDTLMASAAKELNALVVGIILSGTGTDGGLGLRAIGDAGGLTLVQQATDANYTSMPNYALSVEVADRILPAKEMMKEIKAFEEFCRYDGEFGKGQIEKNLESICDVLKANTKHDFRHYKSSTLIRRIQRRMQVQRASSVASYVEFLRKDVLEVDLLFKELLINVTSFFRDPSSFESLREHVLEPLLDNVVEHEKIRVWVAGCSTGEEAYTLAILFMEAFEKKGIRREVQIIATDIDEHALAIARKGIYAASIANVVSETRLEKFFTRKSGKYAVRKEVRELCLFSAHNLVNDPPFSQIDLVSCRNVLIYFGTHLQQKLIPIFHYSLRGNGCLFLGNSESVSGHGELFKTISAKDRIAQKKVTGIRSTTEYPFNFRLSSSSHSNEASNQKAVDFHLVGQRILLDEFAPRYAIVSDDQNIFSLSEGMDTYLIHPVGHYESTLSKLIRPELRVALRSTFKQAQKEKRKITHSGSTFRKGDEVMRVKITVQPMPQLGTEEGLYMVVFTEQGTVSEGDDILGPASENDRRVEFSVVEQLEKELAHVKSDLDRTVQDLEASNEELKSSNEELLSMNEELQSANEELESSKEEVQSANDSLLRTNTDLENILSSTQIATLFLDDNLNIKSFTPAVSQIYNILPRDVGRSILHLSHLSSHIPVMPDPTLMDENQVDAEISMPDGRVFLRRILPYMNEGNRRDGLVITFTDVTKLRQNEGLFQAIANVVPALTWTTDAAGHADYFNAQWTEYTGLLASVSLGSDWLAMVEPSERIGFAEQCLNGLSSGVPFASEVRLRNDKGDYQWFSVRGLPVKTGKDVIVKWVFNAFNIDRSKKLLTQTAANEVYFRQLPNMIPQKLWRADAKGRFSYFSQQWLNYVGQNEEEALEKLETSIHPDDRQAWHDAWAHSIASGSEFELEHRIKGADGQHRWFISRASITSPPSGKVEWLGTSTDLDERKRNELKMSAKSHEKEHQLLKDRQTADKANEMKSNFLANMSHEIRTPLGAILGFCELLSENLRGGTEAFDFAHRIKNNASELAKLIDEILDLSRVEANRMDIEKSYFDPNKILNETVGTLEIQSRAKNLAVCIEWKSPQAEVIYSDPTRFRQILLNVLGNAVKFTDKGRIAIDLAVVTKENPTRRLLQIDVSDSGIGMSKETLGKIFSPFSQADSSITRKYGGSGLGLVLASRIATALGGKLEIVKSELGVGSTFRLEIDIGDVVETRENLAPHASTENREIPRLDGLNVLVVDDAVENIMIVSRYLTLQGAVVQTASNGQEALEKVNEAPFDVVLMDLQMPIMDGYSAMREIRRRGFTVPLIALTAHAMKQEKARALESGFDEYLVKPIDRQALIKTVRRIAGLKK